MPLASSEHLNFYPPKFFQFAEVYRTRHEVLYKLRNRVPASGVGTVLSLQKKRINDAGKVFIPGSYPRHANK